MRKSDGFGSPTGRDASTMRLAWAMVVPPDFIFVTVTEAKQASLVKRKDWIASSRRTPRHSGASPPGPRDARPDDRLRDEPGISRFRVRSFHERPGMTASM